MKIDKDLLWTSKLSGGYQPSDMDLSLW